MHADAALSDSTKPYDVYEAPETPEICELCAASACCTSIGYASWEMRALWPSFCGRARAWMSTMRPPCSVAWIWTLP